MAAHQAPPVPGILQARTLKWVAISFSNAWKWKGKLQLGEKIFVKHISDKGLVSKSNLELLQLNDKNNSVLRNGKDLYRYFTERCPTWLVIAAAAAAALLQSCPTLCDPIDRSPPGSPVPGILQARTLEWVAISFSNAWKWKVKMKSLSRVGLFATPWTAAYQAPPSMGFSRQEYWSGVPSPCPWLVIKDMQI